MVIGALFGRIAVVLVGGGSLGAVEPEGQGGVPAIGANGIRVVAQKICCRECIHTRRVGGRMKDRLTGDVGGVRIGCEVMIERDVFLIDHDHMFDGCSGRDPGCCRLICRLGRNRPKQTQTEGHGRNTQGEIRHDEQIRS